MKLKQKLCWHCNKKFMPSGNPQVYCSVECSFFSKIIVRKDGCWSIMHNPRPNEYAFVTYDNQKFKGHRLSWMIYHERSIPDDKCILHKCDHPWCVNPDCLYLGTHQDNMDDKVKRGRARGGRALNATIVWEIRKWLELGTRQEEIALRFGISQATVSHIKLRKSWRDLK